MPSAEESKMDRTRLLLIGMVALVLSAALSYVVYQRLQATSGVRQLMSSTTRNSSLCSWRLGRGVRRKSDSRPK